MAPAVTIDDTPDFELDLAPAAKSIGGHKRTLLLAPPSVASHPTALSSVTEAYDRNATDIQMLDRLALGLVALPSSTYDLVLLLTDVDQSRQEGRVLLDRDVMERIVISMKNGGRLRSQDGTFGQQRNAMQTEAILAGLVISDGNGMMKPDSMSSGQTVRLSFGKKKTPAAVLPAHHLEAMETANRKKDNIPVIEDSLKRNNGAHANGNIRVTPAGVGFIDNDDDLDVPYGEEDEDVDFPSNEELENADRIDPDTLLSEADRQRPLIIPEACKPNTKRRRACKDCTCGLAERLEAEDKAKRANADANLAKLSADDLAEVDFTVQGKVGSCGNCALGDAFRCDGCPYIGLPAFKPGEEVRLLNNDVQL